MRNLDKTSTKRSGKKKVVMVWVVLGVVALVLFGGLAMSYLNGSSNEQQDLSVSNSENEEDKNPVLDEVDLGQSYTFSALNSSGVVAGEVTFRITKAEKTKEVLVQGRPANAKGDKAFLVLHIEIDNAEVEKRYISPVDILRLVNEEGKKFAPDIHSDVVEIQPISTKITRVGFVTQESNNNFLIQVGELDGEKSELQISF